MQRTRIMEAERDGQGKTIYISNSRRTCINCKWYSHYYRQSHSAVPSWIPADVGLCTLTQSEHYVLRQGCRDFEWE